MSDRDSINWVKKNSKIEPKVLLNIGVGHRPHCEANEFKKVWPNIRNIGLEPNTNVFLDRILDFPGELYPWALWSTPCLKELSTSLYTPRHSSLLLPDSRWVRNERHQPELIKNKQLVVSCVTLDQLDKTFGCLDDIFLWMDIEGAELEALKGGKSLLASGRIKWIDMEVSHKTRRIGDPSEDDLGTYLKDFGFSIEYRYGNARAFHNILCVLEEK